jgi:hypothetical protein
VHLARVGIGNRNARILFVVLLLRLYLGVLPQRFFYAL